MACLRLDRVHQLARQIDIFERTGSSALLEVGTRGMPALGIFVIIKGQAIFLHSRRKLARMLWADAVVLGGGVDERCRIFPALRQRVIGRHPLPELAHRRVVDTAIFALPRGTGGDLRDAQHVEQRNVDHHRIPIFGMLGEFDPHQQPAVRAAANPQPTRTGDLGGDQVPPDRGEIVIDDLALGPEPGFMPRRAELAPAANVRDGVNPAALEP